MKTKFIFLSISLIISSLGNAVYPQDKIVEGATDFLIERANDNFIYIFEQKIKDNKILQNYLPNTYSVIFNAGIRTLLTNGRVWRESVTADIDSLYSQVWVSLGQEISIFPEDKLDALKQYLPGLEAGKFEYQGNTYPLNVYNFDDPEYVRTTVDNITNTYDHILNLLNEIKNELSIKPSNLIENITQLKSKKIKLPVLANIDTVQGLIRDYYGLLNAKNYSISGKDSLLLQIEKIKPVLDTASDIITSAQILADTSYSFSYRIINAFIIVDYLIKRSEELTGESFINSDAYDKYFDKFKQYSLFFAQLSDATSAEQVKNILIAATVPSVSFGLKRNNSEFHIAISSYLGFSLGIESINGFEQSHFIWGLSTPIGLEFSYGIGCENSLSLLFSILDFGPPVNSKLHNSDTEYKLGDLVVPGIYLTYGIKDLPLAISLGYYNGKGYKINSSNVNHFIISFAFDMPLVFIY